VAELLAERGAKVVFAESCTGGLVSGSLTAIPGISQYHCGGVVVYRNETKSAYLGIQPRVLKNPGPVSPLVARQMAVSVLKKTPEARLALAVTGHLGPDAPGKLDGQIHLSIAQRTNLDSKRLQVETHRLQCEKIQGRRPRQRWVVEQALLLLAKQLQRFPSHKTQETD
jgi:nicotinamide-nucleotide amidase